MGSFASSHAALDRKQAQLCARMQQLLTTSLSIDIRDPSLESVFIDRVAVNPGGGFSVVVVVDGESSLSAVQSSLERATPIFRSALARGLHRKRVPQLLYAVMPSLLMTEV
jgi:ribosome-binding factor A